MCCESADQLKAGLSHIFETALIGENELGYVLVPARQ
jgi:hypothetical protein